MSEPQTHHEKLLLPGYVRPAGVVLVCVGAWLRWWVVLDTPIDLGRIGVLLFAVGAGIVLAAVAVGGTSAGRDAAGAPEVEYAPALSRDGEAGVRACPSCARLTPPF